jgi:type I restriction-modification system DNA methylase subunit
MSIEEQISQLIEKRKYETNTNQSEADIRANYIDRLFSYLGWDVWGENPQHPTTYHREAYIRGAGYVDVGLEINRQPVLMLEAKRFGVLTPSTERKYDRTLEEKQLFKYARGKKIPYCILTNFERLHVFNADHERLILTFDSPTEYLDRLPELLRLSPERVKAGSLEAWERQLEIKDVDEAFLASLQSWRLRLANSIYQHNLSNPVLRANGSLDFDKLMAAVQRILDRLILIRYADDKEVLLTYDVIDAILSNYRKKGGYVQPGDLMKDFVDLSHRMDNHHNTTLFQPGHICEQVFVPNEVFEQIMEEMNNISFRKFTSDILGNTYETYLGTKLVLKDGEIKSEARRDIRKAGGIFYTPPMIVHYIVDNTLGCLLNELEKQHGVHAIEKAKEIKVLDPACGSGSFLTYAYRVFANFYRRMNQQIEDKQVKLLESVASPDMFKRLDLVKQLPQPLLDYPHHILQKQLYGVDIDPEAAEIAAVNLTMQAFADARQEKLPLILNENIKVGNSLISGNEQELCHYFGDNWKEKRPFNWEKEFPQILGDGRFDVVIGNPPYGADFDENDRAYIEAYYPYSRGNKNSAMVFMERGLSLLKDDGLLGYIIPKSLAFSQKWASGRELILDKLGVVCDVSKAFKEVLLEQVIVVISEKFSRQDYYEAISWKGEEEKTQNSISRKTSAITGSLLLGVTDEELAIFHKLSSSGSFMKDISKTARGLPFQKYVIREPEGVSVYRGDHITRYALYETHESLPKEALKGAKEKGTFLQQPKILSQRIVAHVLYPVDHIILMSTFDESGVLTLDTVENTVLTSDRFSYSFIVALLNSKLWSWYAYRFIFSKAIRTMDLDGYYLGKLPLPTIDLQNPEERKQHDELVALTEKMLKLNKRLASIGNVSSDERDKLIHEIKCTDAEIGQKVYDLYGLTEEERQIIEASLQDRASG